ncbi:shikimate dehydrogenase [Thermoflavimicrobium daqui]|uniref:Shikimate dehydrogenase (NADP(+)) n=1 Tax=Thermoflavimicrobium daqui TaxID=2137476 RepID=A0A364K6B0_9BACL|nr:shikimate dehydrogenase [Thermoflavimicrobium daqui]RAL25817.1 shikimate dehydrogenase [Thermoflavimicrobium daqui]
MRITSQTGAMGLIGHPVAHSKSPDMMNRACQYLGLPYVYLAYDIDPEKLEQAVNGMKSLKFRGFNVTIPYKVEVINFLDELDDSAKEIGAVNTVVQDAGKWVGHNTDGVGYLRSLVEEIPLKLSEQKVVMLGAGGAARAVGYALATAGVRKISIANRTVQKADQLAKHLSRWTSTEALALSHANQSIQEATLLINTTSIGMHPNTSQAPIPKSWLHENLVVSDLIYHPKETELLQTAKQLGAQVHNGLGMLVHQAAIAFELWLGKAAPIQLMKEVLEASLSAAKKKE